MNKMQIILEKNKISLQIYNNQYVTLGEIVEFLKNNGIKEFGTDDFDKIVILPSIVRECIPYPWSSTNPFPHYQENQPGPPFSPYDEPWRITCTANTNVENNTTDENI